jgi:hypothetical protein
MATRQPPRYVPTLTEVVSTQAPRAAPDFSEEQLVHRILQRIDLTLERKLREAVATTVIEQTRNLGPVLRAEIEHVVRETVSQALAEELSASQRGLPPRG